MRLSAKLIVAAFCFFIVLTPAILISFLAAATNEAVTSIVPFWNGAIAHSAAKDAGGSLSDVLFVMKSIAETLATSSGTCFEQAKNGAQCAAAAPCGGVLRDGVKLISQLTLARTATTTIPNISLVVLRRNGTAQEGVPVRTSSGAATTTMLNLMASSVACYPSPAANAAINASNNTILFNVPSAWFTAENATENIAAIAMPPVSEQQDGGIGAGVNKAVAAVAPILRTNYSLVGGGVELVLVLLVACSPGTGSMYPIEISPLYFFPLLANDGLRSAQVACGPQIFFASALGMSHQTSPAGSIAFLITQNKTTLTTQQGGVCLDLVADQFTACMAVASSIAAAPSPRPSLLAYLLANTGSTVFSFSSSLSTLASPTVFDYFVTVAWVSERLGLTYIVPQSTSLNLLRGAQVTSVVVGVAVTAVVIVVTMTLLHYVFHPLKVVGALLRCCADVRLYDVEDQTPSVIEEIFLLQKVTDALVRHMTLISKYMPDKSQIQNALADDATTTNPAGVTSSKRSVLTSRLATVSHAIYVRVEYRSRRFIGEARDENDTRKTCSFQFEYAHEANLLATFVQHIHERLQERQGESLQLFFHPTSVAKGAVKAAPYFPLKRESDLMQAIEFTVSNNSPCLNIVVTKSSQKDFVPWLLTFSSFVEASLVVVSSLDILSSVEADRKQCGLALLFSVVCNFVVNIFLAMVLVRKFARKSEAFAHWMNEAMQETLVAVLASSFCVRSIRLMFSHTRFTKALRFNAPWNVMFRPHITRIAFAGLVLGDIVPTIIVIYFLSLGGSLGPATGIMMFWCIFSVIWFFGEVFLMDGEDRTRNIFASLNRKMQSIISPTVDNDFENASPSGLEVLELSTIVGGNADSATPADEATVMEATGASASSPTCAPKSLYLGLCNRHATVLQISLHNAVAHFDIMDAVEIQACCSTFLSHVQREVRLHGGLILRVFPNATVLIGFNCHTQLDEHLSACLNFFFSLDCLLSQSMQKWSTDDWEQPSLVGALVSSAHCCVGYAGSGDSRNFHHVGPSHEELEVIASVGLHYGAKLVTTRKVAHTIESKGISVKQDVVDARSAVMKTAAVAESGHSQRSSSSKLFCRLIDCVTSSPGTELPSYSREISSFRSRVGAAVRSGKQHVGSSSSSAPATWTIPIFEVVLDAGVEFQSSSSAFAHVGSAGDDVDRLVITSSIRSHCARFPDDVVAHGVLTRMASSFLPRQLSPLGIYIASTETAIAAGTDGSANAASLGEGDSGQGSHNVAAPEARQNHILSKICTSEKYVLFFSEI